MSRKLILSLAAIGTLATAALVSGSANAMVSHGHGNNGHRPPISRPHTPHFHQHVYIRRIYGHGYVRPVGYAAPVAGFCSCLTKDYTPEGTVVFQDLCTKEIASAPVVSGPAPASEVPSPTNFAGRTYQDYLAANPQAQAAAPKN